MPPALPLRIGEAEGPPKRGGKRASKRGKRTHRKGR